MYRRAILPFFARIDPETAHIRTLQFLAGVTHIPLLVRMLDRMYGYADPRLSRDQWGLHFRNPLGIAAGLDKNAHATTALLHMGWGHVEVGTVTPLPQPGNPRPRIFRLPEDGALINRMGFPGEGCEAVRHHLATRPRSPGVVGVNVGANKASVEAGTAVNDYVQVIERLYHVADYLTINISSPNTARLRALQGKQALAELVHEVVAQRDRMPTRKPLLIKIAPDLTPAEIDDVLDVCLHRGIDGLVATNTTIARPPALRSRSKRETGGLSGQPLRDRATDVVRHLYRSTNGQLPIVGAGGITTAEDAYAKLAAGASCASDLYRIYLRRPRACSPDQP